jgi:hypothetical protein
MLRVLLVALCAILLWGGAARAEDGVCKSIADRDCAQGVARVTTRGDLRVEVFTRKRSLSFPLSAASSDERDEYAASCVGGKCACDEDVQYFEFKGPVPGFRRVNAIEHDAAAKMKCSIGNSTVLRTAGMFSVGGGFVSTAVYGLEYCRTCGGSCHGRTVLATYAGRTGDTVLVRDALKPDAVGPLRQHVIDYFVATFVDEADRPRQRERLAADLAARAFLDEGIFVENGTVYVNLDRFALSCADSSFYPVPIPAALLNETFLRAP